MATVNDIEVFEPEERAAVDHRDADGEEIKPAPYPPGYDDDGNLIEESDSTLVEEEAELADSDEEEEVETEKKKGSGSGDGGDKAARKKIRELERRVAELEKEKRRTPVTRGKKPQKKEGSPKATANTRFKRGGKRVNKAQTVFPKMYGVGSDKDLSAHRGGSR